MYLLYLDESGDVGPSPPSRTPFFVVSGVAIHESDWSRALDDYLDFRRATRAKFKLGTTVELHASYFLTDWPDVQHIVLHHRLDILRNLMRFEAARMPYIRVISAVVQKRAGVEPVWAWERVIQRFEKTLRAGNLPGGHSNDRGLVLIDGQNKHVVDTVRKMRRFNIIGQHGNQPLKAVIEDAVVRDSARSYFIQACDVHAWFLYQHHRPKRYTRERGCVDAYGDLLPVIAKQVSPHDPWGVIRV